ncbi:16009_t:CDS:1, partial [Acaulospora morrowiae]
NEREAEAQQHFQMFAQLAGKLDRIIVLPNVERKQIGACKKYSFDYYYSIESLKAMYPNVKFMLQEQFKRWANERYLKPSVRKIIISDGRYKGKNSAERYCLNEFSLNYNALESNLIILKGKRRNAANLQKEVIKISTNDTVSNIEVLLFEYSSRHVIFPQETPTSINYSEFIINEVTDMVSKLTPYIAIHWQMERINPESMPKCAEKLALKANNLKLRYNISNVYLVTDYPLKSNLEMSASFRNITSFHHKAIRILRRKASFESFLSFIIKNRWGDIVKWKKLTDTGLPEILDKLMCIRAKILLTPPSECKGGQKNDNYADIIIEERKKLLQIEAGEQAIDEGDQWIF